MKVLSMGNVCAACRRPFAALAGLPVCKCAVTTKPRKKPKYGNEKVNGFDSKREYRRYRDLCLLQKAGEISDLKTQVSFIVVPQTERFRAVRYIADFTYKDKHRNLVVEDSKGVSTSVFKIKQKLMYHVHGIEVLCV